MIAEPLLLTPEKCPGDALVNKSAVAQKPHFPLVEVRMLSSTAGGLMPVGTVSTIMRAIFPPPRFSWSLDEETKERTNRTNFNQLAPPFWRKVMQKILSQNMVFDSGGCPGRLRSCPLQEDGARCFVGEVRLGRCDSIRRWGVFVEHRTSTSFSRGGQSI